MDAFLGPARAAVVTPGLDSDGADTTKQHDWHTIGQRPRDSWKLEEGGWCGAWQSRGKLETEASRASWQRGTGAW